MYKNMNKDELLKLHNSTLTQKEYYLDLIENINISSHEHICDGIKYSSKGVTIGDTEILIKVVK